MIILGIYDYCIMTNRTNNTNNNNIDNACFVIKNIIFIYLKKKNLFKNVSIIISDIHSYCDNHFTLERTIIERLF